MGSLTLLAVAAAIFVNGATDAPGNIAGAVSSGSISFKRACCICGIFNFIGMAGTSLLFPAIAKSTGALVAKGDAAVPASLCAVVMFSSGASMFGIPTSESHGLIAALGGAAIYYGGSPGEGFGQIILKSALSCICGFAAGMLVSALASSRLSGIDKKAAALVQGSTAAAESLCHGMQDGQKFLSLLQTAETLPTSLTLFLSAVMALGCLFGTKRITRRLVGAVGIWHKGEAVSSDLAGISVTLASSLAGIPVSTTYMKSCAMFGSSLGGGRLPRLRGAVSMILTWIFTYPVCMALSFILCHAWEKII